MLDIDRSLIERPYRTRWWGSYYMCDPRFVGQALGDGNVLLLLQPLNTRPHHYLIRVDSSWHLQGCYACHGKCPDELTEHLDEVYDAIEEEYGWRPRVEESNAELEAGEEPDPTDWPVFDDGVGTCWNDVDEPQRYSSNPVVAITPRRRLERKALTNRRWEKRYCQRLSARWERPVKHLRRAA